MSSRIAVMSSYHPVTSNICRQWLVSSQISYIYLWLTMFVCSIWECSARLIECSECSAIQAQWSTLLHRSGWYVIGPAPSSKSLRDSGSWSISIVTYDGTDAH
ncbi:hypothetical protein K474DRAFT_627214 [Panus rudis PR-1116 ss-1]|nr:hypothetical protein K474DRAFT_627214 [Panus rudis PR-1116 ss-1]